MDATMTIEVLAAQLAQIKAQLDHLVDKPVWECLGITDAAVVATRLDDASHAVRMAMIRVQAEAAKAKQKEAAKLLAPAPDEKTAAKFLKSVVKSLHEEP
jgi:hypothetical protein